MIFCNQERLQTFLLYSHEGQGSSMNYQNMKTNQTMATFYSLRKSFFLLKYQLYEGTNHTPYKIDLKFIPNKNTTKIIWYITTPRTSFLGRAYNLISEDYIASTIDKSMINLSQVLRW